jgi:hypothetical protein
MWPGEAILLHGTLPPIHLAAIRWWQDKRLRHLHAEASREKESTDEINTCPLSDKPAGELDPILDSSTLALVRAQLPPLQRPSNASLADPPVGSPRRRPIADPEPGSDERTDDDTDEHGEPPARPPGVRPNRYKARCERCHVLVPSGEGYLRRLGDRQVVLCWPSCNGE